MTSKNFDKLSYMIPLKDRNNGDSRWLAYEDRQAKHLEYDLRIQTPAHGWRHVEYLCYSGCLIQIYYLDNDGNEWYFYKKPNSLLTVELPDDVQEESLRWDEDLGGE